MQYMVAAVLAVLAIGVRSGRVAVWTDHEDPIPRGEDVRVRAAVSEPGHLMVVRIDTEGRARVLFPGTPWDDAAVAPGAPITVSPREASGVSPASDASFVAEDSPGIGYLLAVISDAPPDLSLIASGGHWELQALEAGRIIGDPYSALSRLAERIAGGARYDYDIAPYYVERRYDYPRFVCYDCHAPAPGWDAYREACERFAVVVYDDPYYYPYRQYARRAVAQTRPRTLLPRFEFRERRDSAVVWRTREDGGDRAAGAVEAGGRDSVVGRASRRQGLREGRDTVRPDDEPERPAVQPPRSLGAPQLRPRPRRRPDR